MGTIVSRPGYCKNCHDNHQPKKGTLFLVYGTYRGSYYTRIALKDGIRGITPTIFILKQVTNKGVCIVDTLCGICGIEKKKDGMYGSNPQKWTTIFLSIADWNGLITYKREPCFTI